jgi:hypothetical protein
MKLSFIILWSLSYIAYNCIEPEGDLIVVSPGTIEPDKRAIQSMVFEIEGKAVEPDCFILPVYYFQWLR